MMSLIYGAVLVSCLALFTGGTLHDQRQTGDSNYNIDMEDVLVVALLDEAEGGELDYSYDYSDLTVKPEHDDVTPTTQSAASSSESANTTSQSEVTSSPTPTSSPSSPIVVLGGENNSVILTNESNKPNVSSSGVILTNKTSGNSNSVILPGENKPVAGNSGVVILTNNDNKPAFATPELPLNTHNMQIPVVVVTETNKLKKGYVSSSTLRRKESSGGSSAINSEALPKRNCLQGFFLDEKNRCKKVNRKAVLDSRNRPPLPFGLHYAKRPAQLPAP